MNYRLRNKYILIISPENWGINYVSKHHYAEELALLGNKVYFLNHPASHTKITKIKNDLYSVDYKTKYRGLRRLPSFISSILIKKEIINLEKLCRCNFDVIWNFDSSRFFNLSRIYNKIKIAHLVDLTENFERSTLSKTSDICLTSSEHIRKEILPYNSNVFNIGHGVSERSAEIDTDLKKKLVQFKSDFGVLACYVGNLTITYLDWDLLLHLIEDNPKVGFVLIGPAGKSNISKERVDKRVIRAEELPNTLFAGPRPAAEIATWLRQMDIHLLLYKSHQHKEQLANPHKLLEYLYSGKVIVASWTDEYKNKRELMEMFESNKVIHTKFKNIVSDVINHNSRENVELRKNFAKKSTYNQKIKQIEKLIESIQ